MSVKVVNHHVECSLLYTPYCAPTTALPSAGNGYVGLLVEGRLYAKLNRALSVPINYLPTVTASVTGQISASK